VADGAVGAQGAVVAVFVARGALRGQVEKGARLVAFLAVCCKGGMPTVEGESSLLEVIESGDVQRSNVPITAHVFCVTDGAVTFHFSVDAFSVLHSVGDFGVTAETLRVRHTLAGIVTFLAVVQPLELGVGLAEGTGREELAQLLTIGRIGYRDDGKNQ
jgi:NAD/NADP transhydrogenase beta subunit